MVFASLEFSGGSSETKDDDSEESSSKKKKTGSSAVRFGVLPPSPSAGESSVVRPAKIEAEAGKVGFEGWLRKIRGEASKPKEKQSETVLSGFLLPKPETAAKDTAPPAHSEVGPTEDEAHAKAVAGPETVEFVDDQKEKRQRAQEFVDLQLDGIERELPLTHGDSAEAVDLSASFAYYRAIEEGMADNVAADPEAVAERAAHVASGYFDIDPEDLPDIEAAPVAGDAGESGGVEPTDDDFDIENDPYATGGAQPRTSGSGGVGGPGGPANPNTGGNYNAPPIPTAAAGGSGGANVPPFTPGAPFGGAPMPGGMPGWSVNHTPSSPNYAPTSGMAPEYNAARAAAQGLLIGGVAGYFIGRHRGRKQGTRAAEKRATPIRKSLEKQVQQLQQTMLRREAEVRELAREKMRAVQAAKDREKIVSHVMETAAAPSASEKPLRTPTEVLATSPAERSSMGRLLGEVPLAAAAVIAAPAIVAKGVSPERPVAVGAISGHAAESNRKPPEVMPFNKDVREFSQQELLAASEKITVEGTSLKQMTELGRLDEPGLRRVVGEFLQGGDVVKAFNREAKEKDLRYEQDPGMRHHDDRGGASTDASTAGSLIVGNLLGNSMPTNGGETGASSGYGRRPERPQLDEASLRTLRNRQAATLAATVAAVAVMIVIALLATR